MNRKQGVKGFTLVEVVVVSAIGVIVAFMLLAFIRAHNSAINEGVARSKIQLQLDLVSAEIAHRIRESNLVLGPGEAWSASPDSSFRDAVNAIRLCDDTGGVMRAFQIAGDTLKEGSDGIAYTPYKAGGDIVRLAAGSGFGLIAGRKRVILNMKVATLYRSIAYQTIAKRDMYLCRN